MERFKFLPMDDEIIPETPPEPAVRLLSGEPETGQIFVVPYLSVCLLESASRLLEISKRFEGNYRVGKEIPATCRAASTGVIAVSCAAFEAALNEAVFNYEEWAREHSAQDKARTLHLSMKSNLHDRLDALAAAHGVELNWGTKNYQSLDLLISVRKHLLHHEASLYNLTEGHWPARKIRDLVRQIRSPYQDIDGLEWHQHILTPSGAEWAFGVVRDSMQKIDEWWEKKREML